MIAPKTVSIWMAAVYSFLAIELIPLLSGSLADLAVPAFSNIDPDEVFVWLSAHHLFMLALSIIIMTSLFRAPLSHWGFNFNRWRTSLVIIIMFALTFFLIEYAYMSDTTYSPGFPLTTRNELGWQGFQYLMSGTAEEPLFRGFVIVLLLNGLHSDKPVTFYQHVFVVALSTAFFMFAHLNIDWLSLSVSGYNFAQQTKAFQLGVLFAIVFIHTRSLFAPIVLHGLSNGITATIGFYLI